MGIFSIQAIQALEARDVTFNDSALSAHLDFGDGLAPSGDEVAQELIPIAPAAVFYYCGCWFWG